MLLEFWLCQGLCPTLKDSAWLLTKAEQNPWQIHSCPSVIWKTQCKKWHSWDRQSGGILASECRCDYVLFKGTHWFFHKSVGYRNLKDPSHLSGETTEIYDKDYSSSEQWQLSLPLPKLGHCKSEYKIRNPVRKGDTAQETVFTGKLPQGKIGGRSCVTCYIHR